MAHYAMYAKCTVVYQNGSLCQCTLACQNGSLCHCTFACENDIHYPDSLCQCCIYVHKKERMYRTEEWDVVAEKVNWYTCTNITLDTILFTSQCISHYRPFHVKLIVLTVECSFAR